LTFENTLLLLKRLYEHVPLLRQDEGLGQEVEVLWRVSVLHATYVQCKAVFASEFYCHWKVINFLIRIQSLIEVALSLSMGPKNVPIMSVRGNKPVKLKQESYKLGLTLQHLVVAR
jgi:hypothetical protein